MQWLEFISVMFFAVGFMFPTCACCLAACSCCTSDAPGTVQVVVSGITNGTCGSCTNLNGTYILSRGGSSGLLPCSWFVDISTVCTVNRLNLTFAGGGGCANLLMNFRQNNTNVVGSYGGNPAGYDDCANWSALSIGGPIFTADCGGAASTCEITAL